MGKEDLFPSPEEGGPTKAEEGGPPKAVRLLRITGPTPEAVQQARAMIDELVANERSSDAGPTRSYPYLIPPALTPTPIPYPYPYPYRPGDPRREPAHSPPPAPLQVARGLVARSRARSGRGSMPGRRLRAV